MPYNENKKLQRFADEVISTAEAERTHIERETESQFEELLAVGKSKIRDEALDYLAKEIDKLRQKSSHVLSRHTMQQRKELLLYREKIIRMVSEKVHARLSDFIQSPDYKDYLVNLCIKVLSSQNQSFTLYVSEGDMQYSDYLLSAIARHPSHDGRVIGIFPEKKIKLGGIRFLSKSGRILINETIDENLNRQNNYLITLFGPISNVGSEDTSTV